MAKPLITCLYLVLVLYLSIAKAARISLSPVRGRDHTQSSDDREPICKTLVQPQGYACEDHNVHNIRLWSVTTKDGYILSLQRMPVSHYGKKASKPPVLLQHGLYMDGSTWLLNPADESLAFILADNGYDVWITNTRGTKWSQGHTFLSPSDAAFWDWTWDELAAFELPAVVDYIHNQTQQKLYYVGHSLGSLTALVSFSQNKVLDMLRSAALLSPIAHLNHIASPLTMALARINVAEELYGLGFRQFVPGGLAAAKLVKEVCDIIKINCSYIVTLMTGSNCCLNSSMVDTFLNQHPQPTAMKNVVHLTQMIRTGKITMYDYGNDDDNMEHYGQPTPPTHDMANIPKDFPLFLGHGGQDIASDVTDVNKLIEDLKDHNLDKLVVQYVDSYAHLDFVFAINANRLIYDPIMAFFSRY